MDAVDFFSKKLFNSFTFSISYRLVSPPTEMIKSIVQGYEHGVDEFEILADFRDGGLVGGDWLVGTPTDKEEITFDQLKIILGC